MFHCLRFFFINRDTNSNVLPISNIHEFVPEDFVLRIMTNFLTVGRFRGMQGKILFF